MVLGLTITASACSNQKTTNSLNGSDNSSAITSPQPSNENNQSAPSPTVKPPTNSQSSSSSGEKASSKITDKDQAAKLVKETIFNNNEGIVMAAFNDVESYNGFQCYRVKASSKAIQASGGSGTIGLYDVEIESGRIWDLSTNKLAIDEDWANTDWH